MSPESWGVPQAPRHDSPGGTAEVPVAGGVGVAEVRVEHHREPFGIGEAAPRLSWTVRSSRPGWEQAAYQVRLLDDAGAPGWTGDVVASDGAVLVGWPAPALGSQARVAVQVRVWTRGEAEPSRWSPPRPVETGLLDPGQWTARLVGAPWDEPSDAPASAPLLRREFELAGEVSLARLYATAHGVYEVEINGVRVGDHVLAPGWTSYHHRLRYQTHDVTALLRPGANVIGARLAEGWYAGRLGFDGGRRAVWGDRLGLLAQLEVTAPDGTRTVIGTDERWWAHRGPTSTAELYDGEVHDARREQPGWSAPGFTGSGWEPARTSPAPAHLVAPDGPPVRRVEERAPVDTLVTPSGATVLDFGQNLVGRLRIRVRGAAGQVVTLRHAEVLENGELGTRPLRHARATDVYTLRGDAEEVWEPRFTVHGFRYAEVTGWPGELRPGDVLAVVCHTDVERAGWFSASDPLLERLHENAVWSLRGNLVDVPTDCPQRDERLGWTGDLQVFAPAATFLYRCAGTVRSWLRDLAAEQLAHPERLPPLVVPDPLGRHRAFAAWGDATTVVPWVLYQRCGDLDVLAAQWPSMTAWVDLIAARAGADHLWEGDRQLGDWLDPAAPPEDPGAGRTAPGIVATAYLARSAEIVADAAALLDRPGAATRYRALAARVRSAFAAAYRTPDGRMTSDAQTAYALMICFGLAPDAGARRAAGARLAQLVVDGGHRIGTGFVGTPLVCDALATTGHLDTAYALLTETSCPSFLYPVTMGATTVWERWDSMLPDGTINPGEMTSFNHYALGAVVDWLHRTVAGLAPAEPGYRRMLVAPRPGGGLDHASARHLTPYGPAEVGWHREGSAIVVRAVVPPGTRAVVSPPDGSARFEVGSGVHRFRFGSDRA